jgi:shikimate kinase
MPTRRVVLVGFMASGKTEVGRALAGRLGWTHVDLDAEIERRVGTTIAELFDRSGEAAFRAEEVRITPDVVGREGVVVSTGGGWVTNPGLLEGLPQDTLTVWLKVSPEEVLRRVGATPGAPVRPLLRVADPLQRVESLLAAREPMYARASVTVETGGRSVEEVVDLVHSAVIDASTKDFPPARGTL